MSTSHYQNTIWTNHALNMLKQRKLSQPVVYQAFLSPHTSHKNSNGTWEFTRKSGSKTITVIAKETTNHSWLIISCWIEPPNPNSADYYKKLRYYQYRRSSPGRKIIMHLQKIFFGLDF